MSECCREGCKVKLQPNAFAGVRFVAAEKLIARSAVRERGPSGTHYDRGHAKARRDTNTGAKPFPKQRRVPFHPQMPRRGDTAQT